MNDMISPIAEVMARIHEVGPLLRAHADQADRDRRMPPSAIEALQRTGVFALNTPVACGGLGGGVRAMVEAGMAFVQ